MCQGLARCFLIFFNVLFLIFGVLCLAIGIWVRVDTGNLLALLRISDNPDVQSYDVPSLLENGAYILIAVGALVFVISVFGFCGAIKKSRCCLITYGVLVGIILVIQIAAGIAVGVFRSQFDKHALTFLNNTMPDKYDGPYHHSDWVSLALDAMQATQSCCGINGPDDFAFYTKWNKTWNGVRDSANVPFTCCKTNNPNDYPDNMENFMKGLKDSNCPVSKNEVNTEGCYAKLRDLVETYFKAVLGVAIGVAVMELLLIIIACCIAKKNEDEIV